MRGIELPAQLLIVCLLLHLRFVGLVFSAPVFTAVMAPTPVRYLFAVLLTFSATGALGGAEVPLFYFDSVFSIALLGVRELLIGVALGFLSALPLVALRVAGEQVGTVIGFSMAQVLDPTTQTESSIIGQLEFLVGLWFYYHWNGHLLMIQAVMESVRLAPVGRLLPFPPDLIEVGTWLQDLFILAMRITLPFFCSLVLADVGLGFLARTVPQMNIFVLGLPIKVALGFMVLAAVLPLTVDLIYTQFERWIEFALEGVLPWSAAP